MVAVVQQRRSALNKVLLKIWDLANDPDGAKGSLKQKYQGRVEYALQRVNLSIILTKVVTYLLSDVHV